MEGSTMDNTLNLVNAEAVDVARAAVKILLEKSGIDVKLYNVTDTGAITDYYVVVTGKSLSHVSSLADDLCMLLSEKGINSARIEGKRGNSWILVDYLDVIVHIFDKDARTFYNFERLLSPDSLVDIADIVLEVDKKFEIN